MQASAGAAELAAAQANAAAQLQALESQLASKDAALEASTVRLAALESELKAAHSKVGRVWGIVWIGKGGYIFCVREGACCCVGVGPGAVLVSGF